MTYLTNDTIGVDDEETAQGNSLLLNKDTVGTRDLVVLVGQERDVDATQSSVLARGVCP